MPLTLSGTNGVSGVNGSATTPATAGSDTDTGVFYGTNTVSIATNSTTAVTVDSSQNVGIGVTPSTWSLGKAIEINTVGNSIWATSTAYVMGNNFYYNGGYKFAGTGYATSYIQSTGVHAWSVSTASGTAGNPITFTQAMLLDTGGRFTVTSQPGFMAGIASVADATISANSLVPFNTVTATNAFNTGSNFNTGTSLFTAPVAGRYFFSFTLFLTNSGSSTQSMSPAIRVNGSFISFTSGDVYGLSAATPNSVGGTISISTNVILNLSANDTVGVAARGTAVRVYQGHCFFSGYLLG